MGALRGNVAAGRWIGGLFTGAAYRTLIASAEPAAKDFSAWSVG
jgi:hypothetical protein